MSSTRFPREASNADRACARWPTDLRIEDELRRAASNQTRAIMRAVVLAAASASFSSRMRKSDARMPSGRLSVSRSTLGLKNSIFHDVGMVVINDNISSRSNLRRSAQQSTQERNGGGLRLSTALMR